MPETLRIQNRALWVDHGDGNLDALTGELPIWADEWAERIVAAVNAQPAGYVIAFEGPTGPELAHGHRLVLHDEDEAAIRLADARAEEPFMGYALYSVGEVGR
jgi:hypothetical protein